MKEWKTTYYPYRDANHIYRTGLTEERMKELGLTNDDYNPFKEDYSALIAKEHPMVHRNTDPYPTSEVKLAWLSQNPHYNRSKTI